MSAAAMATLSAMHRHLAAPMPEDHGIRLAAQAGITLMQHQQQQPQQPQHREHLQLHLEWQDEAQGDEDGSTAAADEDVAYGAAGAGPGTGAVAMEVDGPRASRTGARHPSQHQRQVLQQHLQQLGQPSMPDSAAGAPGATFHAASLLGSGAGASGFGGAGALAAVRVGGGAAGEAAPGGTSPRSSSGGGKGKRSRTASGHGFGAGPGPGSSADQHMSLLQWLCRPGRMVQPKESFWVFCEVRKCERGVGIVWGQPP